MARPIEESLSYFPLDVDIFDDPKLLFVAERFDSKGELITIKLLCWIYRNGYYCQWDDEHALIFAKKNFSSIKSALCQDVVSELLKRGFFNEGIFNQFGILTSKAIQKRWQHVIDNSRRKAEINADFNLLLTTETIPKQTLTNPESTESTQSIGKESKEEDSTVNNSGEIPKRINETPVPESLQIEGFAQTYERYMKYMEEVKGTVIKPVQTESHFIDLFMLQGKGNDPIQVINQTISASNKKFYALTGNEFKKKEKVQIQSDNKYNGHGRNA